MSEQDNISVVALLVSLIALIVTLGQLLQSTFGTAEGFRRTNKQIMGAFAQTRDRVFHLTEMRYETRFSTPHFSLPVSDDKQEQTSSSEQEQSKGIADRKPAHSSDLKPRILSIRGESEHDRGVSVNALIKYGSRRISKLQRSLNFMNVVFNPSGQSLMPSGGKEYAAGWLLFLEQLYEHEQAMAEITDDGTSYRYHRYTPGETEPGPDEAQVRYAAIESQTRSWDLLPPDVVRPLATIKLCDLLTLCFRMRIMVQDFHPHGFTANGNGHSFSPLHIQGLGTVVQYRYDGSDRRKDLEPGMLKFVPCEAADKLAFGIIPKNPELGIERDWPIMTDMNFTIAILSHFELLGVSERCRGLVRDVRVGDRNDTWEAIGETLLLLAPFMAIDGLGIVKYVPPFHMSWMGSLLRYTEGQLVLRARLNQMYPGLKQMADADLYLGPPQIRGAPEQLCWVAQVFNLVERLYRPWFHSLHGLRTMFDKNAGNKTLHDCLKLLKAACTEADHYLSVILNEFPGINTYTHLVAAHHEMAIDVHIEVKRDSRGPENQKFRDSTIAPGVDPWKTEAMNRYVDNVTDRENKTVINNYREKIAGLGGSVALTDEEIKAAWFTMMLRGCIWKWAHNPIYLPQLPYASKMYANKSLVFIA